MGFLIKSTITGSKLTATLGTGTIPLPLTTAHELSAGAYLNIVGNGGILASDTTPTLTFSNGGTRATWAAANVDSISWQTVAPPDFDESQALTVNVIASMSGGADTPLIGISFIEGMSNSSVGGNTAAVSGTTPTVKTVTVAASSISGGNQWNITLTPAAHGTDLLRIDAVWINYKRK